MSTGDIVLLDVSFACRQEHQNTPVENPAFSAPEQSRGRAEMRSDLYSLAATICFLANGIDTASCATNQALEEHIVNIFFGAFAHRRHGDNEGLGEGWEGWDLIYSLLNPNVTMRPSTYRDILLNPGTFVPLTSLLGVLDLDYLGFLLLYPSGIFIGSENTVSDELRRLINESNINAPGVLEDVKAFLSGENPWLAA
jgi:serine/threonine protein kinase